MKKENIISLLRISIGWLFFYAGITKVLDSSWSSAGYLKSAQTFTGLYNWLASKEIIGVIDFLNEWGLTLLGVALIIGAFVRLSSLLGALLMLLYYFPVLSFPHVGTHSYIVDEHIIYILVLLLLYFAQAGKTWGIDSYLSKLPWLKKLT